MRILVSCLQSRKSHSIPAHAFWRTYFVRGLEEAGHQVAEADAVDWAEGLVCPAGPTLDAWRERTWGTVLAFVRQQQREPIDLFLGYLYPRQVDSAAIKELHRRGIPCVNFFCDNVREFRSVPSEYRAFDLHWVPELEAVPMYRAAGLALLHAPMPCWIPAALRTVPSQECEPPTFVGSADVLRRDLLGRALQAGADFTIRGPGWISDAYLDASRPPRRWSVPALIANQIATVRDHGPTALLRKVENRLRPLAPVSIPTSRIREAPIGEAEYFRLTRESMVAIGVSRVPTARASHRRPLAYSRLRDIEAPMLGACYLTEWTAGLESLFEPDVEIETYRTPQELSAKLAELSKDAARRRRMRERAQRRALNEHSVARSIARICQQLGLPDKASRLAG
jgi:hypothetical protein